MGYSPNQPRDDHGRFASGGGGSEVGDHQAESPSTETRNVSGRNIPRSQVVTRHGGAQSLGSEGSGSGGGGTVRLDSANSPSTKRKLGTAKQDRLIQMRATDQRHFGIEGDVRARVGKMLPSDLRGRSGKGFPYQNS